MVLIRNFIKVIIFIVLLSFPKVSFANEDYDISIYMEMIESGFMDSNIAENFSIKKGDSEIETSLSYFLIGYLELRDYNYKSAYENFQKSYSYIETLNHPNLKMEILFYISEIELLFYDIPNAMKHSLMVKELAKELNSDERLIDSYFNLADGYRYYYDEKESLKFAKEGYNLSNYIGYNYGKSLYYIYMGNSENNYNNNPEEALKYYNKALNIAPPLAYNQVDTNLRKFIEREIRILKLFFLEDKDVINDFSRAYPLIEKHDYLFLFDYYATLGDYYFEIEKDLDIALENFEKALEFYKKIPLIESHDITSFNLEKSIAYTHYEKGNYKLSADIYNTLLISAVEREYDANRWAEGQLFLDEFKYGFYQERLLLLEELNQANLKTSMQNKIIIFIFVSSTILLSLLLFRIMKEINKNKIIQSKLYKTSITDHLTQAYNREKIMEIIKTNNTHKNAIALIDIDNFKSINDNFGHLVGDKVLIKVSEIIKSSIREYDSLGRYGGEEFLVYLNDISLENAVEISERVRKNIESLEWEFENLKTTVSIGVSTLKETDIDGTISRADEFMYKAKRTGKNMVVFQ